MLRLKNIVSNLVNLRNISCTQCRYSLQQNRTFDGEIDRFNGVTVDTTLQSKTENFSVKLEESLQNWSTEGRRCIWFKVHINDSTYVPLLAQMWYNTKHLSRSKYDVLRIRSIMCDMSGNIMQLEKCIKMQNLSPSEDDFVMMYKWLPVDSEPNLPPASHTNLGVGALVLNEKEQLLAISEKHYDYPHWKLPGGYVERGEDIIDAAKREVKEETGVESDFLSLITFRHSHNMMYGNSDIYILMMMKALTEKITLSTREVKECKWLDIEEYVNHPHVHYFNKFVINQALLYRDRNLKLDIHKKKVKWAQFVREMNFLVISDYDHK